MPLPGCAKDSHRPSWRMWLSPVNISAAASCDHLKALHKSVHAAARAGSNGKAAAAQQALQLPEPEATKAWVLPQTGFSKGLVGGKSRVLAGELQDLPPILCRLSS